MGTVAVHILHCGEVGVDPAVPDRSVSKNPLAFTGLFRSSSLRIWLPVRAYLITAPKGTVLIDTSWNSNVRTHPAATLTPSLYFASKPKLPQGQAVNEQLASLGYKTSDIDYVILTHMDVDHVNGLPLVHDAHHILASQEEIDESRTADIRYNAKQWRGITIAPVPFSHTAHAGPAEKAFDVFGDGTVTVIFTPVHSKGSVCVLVRGTSDGPFVLIAGDTGYTPDSWNKDQLPGPVYNRKEMLSSLSWVRNLSRDSACRAVLACHDPSQDETTITL